MTKKMCSHLPPLGGINGYKPQQKHLKERHRQSRRRTTTRRRWRNEAIVSLSPHLGKLPKTVINFKNCVSKYIW